MTTRSSTIGIVTALAGIMVSGSVQPPRGAISARDSVRNRGVSDLHAEPSAPSQSVG
jgi:hypothetical protein